MDRQCSAAYLRWDNATIFADYHGIDVVGSSTLTLGPNLTLSNDLSFLSLNITLQSGETLVNTGTLVSVSVDDGVTAAGTFINDGQVDITSYGDFFAASVTNDGTITASNGGVIGVDLQTWNAPGAHGEIVLNGGSAYWNNSATLTTAQLRALYGAQHVTTSGTYGFSVNALNNSGATLDIGVGTMLGEFSGGQVTGGSIVDHDASGSLIYAGFTNVAITSGGTLDLSGDTLTNTSVVGAGTILANGTDFEGGSLSGVGTIIQNDSGGNMILDGVNVDGGTGHILIQNTGEGNIVVGSTQNLAGFDIEQEYSSIFLIQAGASTANSTITIASAYDGNGIRGESSGSVGVTFASSSLINVLPTDYTDISGGTSAAPLLLQGTIAVAGYVTFGSNLSGVAAYADNTGVITVSPGGDLYIGSTSTLTNSGTILVNAGTLELNPSALINTGSLSVTNGTLILDGPLSLASLTEYTDPGSQVQVGGNLDLGGRSVILGQGGVPDFSLVNQASIDDGTFTIAAGSTLLATNADSLSFGATLINNGTVSVGSAQYYGEVDLLAPVSGSGTISVDGYGEKLIVNAKVASGQTIAFGADGTSASVTFQTSAVTASFGAKLAGFSAGDSLFFIGETVQSGKFSGDSILVTFSAGGSASIATSTAQTGTLVASGDELYYSANAITPHNWLAGHNVADSSQDSGIRGSSAGATWLQPDHGMMSWAMPLHPQ